jgi:phenylacetic acid degradation operon negative regulatory protein
MNAPRPPATPEPVRALLRHFRTQRPLRAGSLLVTIFGDAIAPRGGAVTLGSLIRLATPFGLTERLIRTAVARLAREGWLSPQRLGRRSEYRLTRSGERRFAAATERIYAENPHAWAGTWTLVLLPAGARRAAQLRDELRWLGFGQLTPALFAHPACTRQQAHTWLKTLAGAAEAIVLQSSATDVTIDRRLAARGWNLAELSRRYRRFVRRFAPIEPLLAAGVLSQETAFLVRTLLIHEYRKIHLRDPLLPPALLPPQWVGSAAYELCRRLYSELFEPAEAHLSVNARRLRRALPQANAAAHARFAPSAALP